MNGNVQWSAWRCSLALPSQLTLKHNSLSHRQVLLLRLRDDQGERWSEAAPLPGWSTDTLHDNEIALVQLQCLTPEQALRLALPAALSAAVGLLTVPTPRHNSAPLPSNTLMLNDTDLSEALLASPCIKLKVGQQSIEYDIQRIAHLLNRLPAAARLRLDANQSWTYDDVQQLNLALGAQSRVDYIEEPLRSDLCYNDWPSITTLHFAHDERLSNAQFEPHANAKALVLKPTLLGWQRTLECHQWAKQHGKTVILSSSFESPIALNLLNGLAKHWQLRDIQGLATAHFFNNTMQTDGELPLTNLTQIEQLL